MRRGGPALASGWYCTLKAPLSGCSIPSHVPSLRWMCDIVALPFIEVDVHAETVVLRGDFDAASGQVLHGLVQAPMAELELVGVPSDGQRKQLVSEADTEHRLLAE